MFHLFSHCWSWLQAIQEPVSPVRSPHAALPGEALPGAQPGQSRLRLDRFEVTLRDLPGAQRSRSAWRSHYSEAHGLLFVLDSADLARMEEARKVLGRVLSHPDASGKPLLLLANKQDAPAALLPCELIERLCLERLVNEHRSPCRIVSAGPAPLPIPLRLPVPAPVPRSRSRSPLPLPFPAPAPVPPAALPAPIPALPFPAGAVCRQAGPAGRPGPHHAAGAALAAPRRRRRPGPGASRRPSGRPRPPARPQVSAGGSMTLSRSLLPPQRPASPRSAPSAGTGRCPGRMLGRTGSPARCAPAAASYPW
uniref:AR13A protein n=1 Tax=Junco hyemalis TaxID=40217 RepID=A0A8C5JD10_JUNHY